MWITRLGLLSLLLVTLSGCQRSAPTGQYVVLRGEVTAYQPVTGELAIRAERRLASGERVREIIDGVITGDSEIYFGGRFASPSEICVGDTVELVGKYDPNPRSVRFAVSYAYFQHPQPASDAASAAADEPRTAGESKE